ncbi:MAG: PEP-CTERM sorting domain-containing protein [Phycisphaerae bacterium]|nr:PEP-CTERM sorting domain-containing protein [Phycisphaerae bacterium]NUQ47965.1 PEP-CTERM sorting domain-containing protein [Phycisphaerae bacterium]
MGGIRRGAARAQSAAAGAILLAAMTSTLTGPVQVACAQTRAIDPITGWTTFIMPQPAGEDGSARPLTLIPYGGPLGGSAGSWTPPWIYDSLRHTPRTEAEPFHREAYFRAAAGPFAAHLRLINRPASSPASDSTVSDGASATAAPVTESNPSPDEAEDPDCNTNGTPDEVEVAREWASDCNTNLRPDECDDDCNTNELPDECEVAAGDVADFNTNDTPDMCEEEDYAEAGPTRGGAGGADIGSNPPLGFFGSYDSGGGGGGGGGGGLVGLPFRGGGPGGGRLLPTPDDDTTTTPPGNLLPPGSNNPPDLDWPFDLTVPPVLTDTVPINPPDGPPPIGTNPPTITFPPPGSDPTPGEPPAIDKTNPPTDDNPPPPPPRDPPEDPATPEPGTAALLLAGACLLRRRRPRH